MRWLGGVSRSRVRGGNLGFFSCNLFHSDWNKMWSNCGPLFGPFIQWVHGIQNIKNPKGTLPGSQQLLFQWWWEEFKQKQKLGTESSLSKLWNKGKSWNSSYASFRDQIHQPISVGNRPWKLNTFCSSPSPLNPPHIYFISSFFSYLIDTLNIQKEKVLFKIRFSDSCGDVDRRNKTVDLCIALESFHGIGSMHSQAWSFSCWLLSKYLERFTSKLLLGAHSLSCQCRVRLHLIKLSPNLGTLDTPNWPT